jgi:hypothetical protein
MPILSPAHVNVACPRRFLALRSKILNLPRIWFPAGNSFRSHNPLPRSLLYPLLYFNHSIYSSIVSPMANVDHDSVILTNALARHSFGWLTDFSLYMPGRRAPGFYYGLGFLA